MLDSDLKKVPLCVDLDGTLIKTDSLYELFLLLFKKNPLYCIIAISWLMKSKAHFKAEITKRVQLSAESLPYNEDVIEYIKAQDPARKILLVTGSNKKVADEIAEHLGLFDEVIASDSKINLTGHNKKDHLVERFGSSDDKDKIGFEYIGNEKTDMPVWKVAKKVSIVSQDNDFLKEVQSTFDNVQMFIAPKPSIKNYLKGIRIHQWVKNMLVFVPLFLDHRFNDGQAFVQVLLTFFGLSILASFTYIINDLLDLESDRLNKTKRKRPFASGLISIKQAGVMMAVLFVIFIAILTQLSSSVVVVLMIYLAATLAYSFYLKRVAMLDVTMLAGLFSLRIIAGIVAIDSSWSFWLLAFSMFFFLSLAFAKRFSEIENLRREGREKAAGRGYTIADLPMLNSSGVAAGYISILVVALYIDSEKVQQMYAHPEILWLICPPLLFWIGRIWLITGRGEMHEDPIVFAIKDKVSLLIVSLCGLILMGATLYKG
ncbi:MAG TPA: UbiA family prenyltransferase [Leucothrix sp.]|nr:UbiA family prenyltransferase [Leucothrix sp.]